MKRWSLPVALAVCIFLKFILFDVIWSSDTTFQSFSQPESYLIKGTIALLLAFPTVFFRSRWYAGIVCFLLDILLVANLMYWRTYYTAIPWNSYFLAGNLADFMGSVYASVRWCDGLFFAMTLGLLFYTSRYGDLLSSRSETKRRAVWFAAGFLICVVATVGLTFARGGFQRSYEKRNTCATPTFTVFGTLCYEFVKESMSITPEIHSEIERWLSATSRSYPVSGVEHRKHCVVILAESFEGWMLERNVEGKEVTPYLNRWLKDSCTLYAPRVQTQVRGGRSIDAQLLVNTGLLPIANGAYSIRFPNHRYPSLAKALKQACGEKGRMVGMTSDKRIVWNQQGVAMAFGFDRLYDEKSFTKEERMGVKKRVGDYPFLQQCAEKIAEEIAGSGDSSRCFFQLVTYSGHGPFIIPDEYKRISFSPGMPEVLNNYLTAANYTDYAIGKFIERLQEEGLFDETMIVVTGDHEGLAYLRQSLCETKEGGGLVSPFEYTPFIVINSPVGMRYEKVMGQSILDPSHLGVAAIWNLTIAGDTTGICPEAIERMKQSWRISDLMIRGDYFRSDF
ncbi:LTA synthase family protein [Barnesiella intestinihominis]|uniref:LTA synthase family protein n=1 Tax=Barnesiella intestinihominis TaxID=487174 RepID=UPI003966EA22